MVIWIVGLSGAGKTTLGREVYALWKARAANTVLIDGDEMRRLFRHDQAPDAYSVAGRRRNAERIGDLCEWLDRQGINVVCCILSLFPEQQRANRARFSHYFEVYLTASLEALTARDSKNLYRPALRGERAQVVGVDIEFPPPEQADMTVDTSGPLPDVMALARTVLQRALP